MSSKVLSLYCVFDVQNLVLCLTRELLRFLDYKIMLKCNSVKLHLILHMLITNFIKIERELTLEQCFHKNVVLYEIFGKKFQWPNTFCTSLVHLVNTLHVYC